VQLQSNQRNGFHMSWGLYLMCSSAIQNGLLPYESCEISFAERIWRSVAQPPRELRKQRPHLPKSLKLFRANRSRDGFLQRIRHVAAWPQVYMTKPVLLRRVNYHRYRFSKYEAVERSSHWIHFQRIWDASPAPPSSGGAALIRWWIWREVAWYL